jgi:glycosyltransferase involved in cell wall biosynthesis
VRVVWLLPDLQYHAAARQASLVVPELVRLGHEVTVADMRAGGPLTGDLPVRVLATRHDLPIRVLFSLDSLLREQPFDLIHAWRLPALRAIGAVRIRPGRKAKLLVSEPRRGGRFTPIDRLLLQRADRIAPDDAPLAVPPLARVPWPRPLRLPAGARVIACLGDIDRDHNFKEAVWAFDVLKFVYPELHLVIIGDGPERMRVLDFARTVAGDDPRIHIVTDRTDGPNLLFNADVVWVIKRTPGGAQTALEARAAGVPVVAADWPTVAHALDHGKAGLLVPPHDPVTLAKVTRSILDDPAVKARLLAAPPSPGTAEVAAFWSSLYSEVVGR